MGDSRAHKRVRPRAEQPVAVEIAGNGFLERTRARDISGGGIGIYQPAGFEGFDTSNEVELVIRLPGEKPFIARAVIRHRSDGPDGFYGLRFTQVSPEDLLRVAAYVEKRLMEGGEVSWT